MSQQKKTEEMENTKVTYTLYKDGKFYIVQNVPARVNTETGEQFFSPPTVEHLHKIILGEKTPVRMAETPIFDFA